MSQEWQNFQEPLLYNKQHRHIHPVKGMHSFGNKEYIYFEYIDC